MALERLKNARIRREMARSRLFAEVDIIRAEVRRARSYGVSRAEVARMAGVSVMTVDIWCEK